MKQLNANQQYFRRIQRNFTSQNRLKKIDQPNINMNILKINNQLTKSNQRIFLGDTTHITPNSRLSQDDLTNLTHSMRINSITPVRLKSPVKQSEKFRNFLQNKQVITESNIINTSKVNNGLDVVNKEINIDNMSSTFMGNYQIFVYISRTNDELVAKKRFIKSFKERNLQPKVKIALISNRNKRKMNTMTNNELTQLNCPRNKIKLKTSTTECGENFRYNTNTNTNTNGNVSPKRYVDKENWAKNPPINILKHFKQIKSETEHHKKDETVENTLRKEFYNILVKNSEGNQIKRIGTDLKKDIKKSEYKVKDTMDKLRQLQRNNDNKLKKIAFILKDFD